MRKKKGIITQQDYRRIARIYEGGCEGQESFFAEDELVNPDGPEGVRGGSPAANQWLDPDEVSVPRRQSPQRRVQR